MATYKVSGMTCMGCANSITNAIKAVAPEADVAVDLEGKMVTVDGSADAAAVAQAVNDAGFEFGGAA
jgi:copper chaperone